VVDSIPHPGFAVTYPQNFLPQCPLPGLHLFILNAWTGGSVSMGSKSQGLRPPGESHGPSLKNVMPSISCTISGLWVKGTYSRVLANPGDLSGLSQILSFAISRWRSLFGGGNKWMCAKLPASLTCPQPFSHLSWVSFK
jgi:hypothetical protein